MCFAQYAYYYNVSQTLVRVKNESTNTRVLFRVRYVFTRCLIVTTTSDHGKEIRFDILMDSSVVENVMCGIYYFDRRVRF